MKAEITIELDNAAFEDGGGTREFSRILKQVLNAYQRRETFVGQKKLRDINGNTVGHVQFIED